jgi:predicted transcriptional regulator
MLAGPAAELDSVIRRWLSDRIQQGHLHIVALLSYMYDMKTSALTIRLDPDLEEQLDRLARESGKSRSELARDALRRQLAVLQFEQARRKIMPFAEARGYLTDEDVFDAGS